MPDATFDIEAHDKSGPAVKGAADGFEKLGDKAAKAEHKINDLGDETGHLARKFAEARVAAMGLAKEFDKTGDARVLKDFEKINREAAKLGKLGKAIKIDGSSINGSGFLKRFTDMFDGLPNAVKGPAAAAGVALVVALEGAVTAGIAGGGLLAGVLLAAQDDRVKAAYSKLGTTVFDELKTDAGGFTSELLDIPPSLLAEFQKQSPRIKRIFDTLSRDVDPILGNIIAAADQLAPSLERAAVAGGKILISLSGALPVLTGATGDLLDSFSSSSGGASTSLNLLVLTAAGAVETFSQLQQALNLVLWPIGKLAELTGITSENVKHLDSIQKDAGVSAGLTAQQYAMLTYDLGSTAGMAKTLQQTFDGLFGTQMGVDQANLAVNAGMLQLTSTIKDNKKTLDETTQSGVENTQVILGQITALDQKRQADIAAGNGTEAATRQANAAYGAQIESLRQLLYSLGLNHAEVDRLITAYAVLAQPQTKTFTTVFRTVGNASGISDQATGHSRTGTSDYGALDGWYAAQFNARGRAELQLAGGGGGRGPHQPPVEVRNTNSTTVYLDGKPFRDMITRSVSAAEQRNAWRGKVGRR